LDSGVYIVWRWDAPSKHFKRVPNRLGKNIPLGKFNYVVYAALKPTDWMFRARGGRVLHQIPLTDEQASLCVVAETDFDPTKEQVERAEEKSNQQLRALFKKPPEQYPQSFIPLPYYNGEHYLPEVLIPFEVEAKVDRLMTAWCKFRRKINPRFGRYPSRYY
jgi:hypothetical protein